MNDGHKNENKTYIVKGADLHEEVAADGFKSPLCYEKPLNWTSKENSNLILGNSEIATIFQASLSSRYYATKQANC